MAARAVAYITLDRHQPACKAGIAQSLLVKSHPSAEARYVLWSLCTDWAEYPLRWAKPGPSGTPCAGHKATAGQHRPRRPADLGPARAGSRDGAQGPRARFPRSPGLTEAGSTR